LAGGVVGVTRAAIERGRKPRFADRDALTESDHVAWLKRAGFDAARVEFTHEAATKASRAIVSSK
jgi:hypothetical protein